MTKLLFICSRNEIRSLTAERMFDGSMRFPDALADKRVVCLRIPDDFEFMQPELVDALTSALATELEGWPETEGQEPV